jgi:hypothetical protein
LLPGRFPNCLTKASTSKHDRPLALKLSIIMEKVFAGTIIGTEQEAY